MPKIVSKIGASYMSKVSKDKQNKEQKGLSDKELVKKYESGKIPLKKIMNSILKTPPPNQSEKTRK